MSETESICGLLLLFIGIGSLPVLVAIGVQLIEKIDKHEGIR